VFTHFISPILNVVISQNIEYLSTKELTELPEIVSPEVSVLIGKPKRYQVILVRSDQIYFVASNAHPVKSVVHEYITGCACRSIPLP